MRRICILLAAGLLLAAFLVAGCAVGTPTPLTAGTPEVTPSPRLQVVSPTPVIITATAPAATFTPIVVTVTPMPVSPTPRVIVVTATPAPETKTPAITATP